MKIAIVGAGAMGSIYAGLLGDAGHDVWAVDRWAEHVDAIGRHGLRVTGASGDRLVHINATTDAAIVEPVDLVVIATKALDVREAAIASRSLLGPETIVVPIQNGLGSTEIVADVLGEERVIVGVVGGFGSSVPEPGHAHHHGFGLLRLGELHGPVTPRLERMAEVWRGAGFNVDLYDDVKRLVWEKLICNVAFSGTCAVLGLTIGEVLGDPNAWLISSRCAREAYDVALAEGIRLSITDPVEYIATFGASIADARPSMLLDLMNGSRSEIDFINGAIPPRARALGLDAPVNETVTALVKAREAHLTAERPRQSLATG